MSNSFTAGAILQMVYAKNINRWPTYNDSEDPREFPKSNSTLELPSTEVKAQPPRPSPVGPRLPHKEQGNIPKADNPGAYYKTVPYYSS